MGRRTLTSRWTWRLELLQASGYASLRLTYVCFAPASQRQIGWAAASCTGNPPVTDAQTRDRWLEVQLIASHADLVGDAYQFSLLIHIACDGRDAKLVVAQRSNPSAPATIAERFLTVSGIDETVVLLKRLGLPGRQPAIRRRVALDAEWFGSAILRVRTGQLDSVASVEIGPHGFEGNDAEVLQALMRQLMSLAGVPERRFWWLLTGVYDGEW